MNPQFFMVWMIGSAITFSAFAVLASDGMNNSRGFNTWCVVVSQTLGACLAYALH